MKLRVLGCHGGTSAKHRSVSFLVNERVALDAGALAAGLSLSEQGAVEVVLVTHAHMDHIGDLGPMTDTRSQDEGSALVVAGIPPTIQALRDHFFNDVLWPDFQKIPTPGAPALSLRELTTEETVRFGDLDVRPVLVDHTIPSCGFLVGDGRTTVAYSGDTGPTERFWEAVNEAENVGAVITEVSYPNRMGELADVSGHLTPDLFAEEIGKLENNGSYPVLVYGLKPMFEEEIRTELAQLGNGSVEILSSGASFEL